MANGEHAGESTARGTTDRLALALEDVGFDVGRDFPALQDAVDRDGAAVVRMGDVRPEIAEQLATLISGAAKTVDSAEEDTSR